jgi:hypothetical protein
MLSSNMSFGYFTLPVRPFSSTIAYTFSFVRPNSFKPSPPLRQHVSSSPAYVVIFERLTVQKDLDILIWSLIK